MTKIKKPISIVLALMMVVSLFAVVPFTASAAETYERLSFIDVQEDDVTGEHFTAHANDSTDQDVDGWALDSDYSDSEYVTLSTKDGTTINKLVLHAINVCGLPAVSVNGRNLSYKTTYDEDEDTADYTFENVNATTVKIYSAPTEECFFFLAWADVYYSVPDPTYTVTWVNWDNSVIETDRDVVDGTTPEYNSAAPTRAEDENNTYTFSGWTDGTNTYGTTDTLPAVTGDITYTATFTAVPKHTHDGITFKEWTSDNSLPTVAGNYVLTSDVTLSGTWTVPEGETNLCLAGYTIRQSGSGSVILLNNGNKKLTVYDDGTTGTITGGNTNSNGGGVNITAGTFTLKGGNIEGNVANNGGGVSVSGESSYFTMAGGTVRYNAGYTYTGGVLQMSSGNFTMTGGTIQNNVGKEYGGVGIADAQPSMSGNAVVKDNVVFSDISESDTKITKTASGYTVASGGTPCDVKHATANGLKINVTGAFESGAQIGIFNNNQTAAFTSGFGANNTIEPTEIFTADDPTTFVEKNADGEVKLGIYVWTVSFNAGDGSGVMEDVLSYSDYKLPACGFTAPKGKFFSGWLSSADNQIHQTGDTVTLTAETQFTAQWGTEAKYQFDFEDGVPEGWQSTSGTGRGDPWYLNTNGGDRNFDNKLDAHSLPNNMTRFGYGSYDSADLITSNFDLSNAKSATLVFWYTNRNWFSDCDQLVVYYQVGDGELVQLFATDGNHEDWTEAKITLPSKAFAENVHFLFRAIDGYGWGIALDDVELNIIGSLFTVTWNNWDGTTLKTDTDVEKDAIPEYNGETPEKGEDENYTYTFSGWTDGTNTYGASDTLPAVTGDITYTATFTATEKHLNGPQDDGYFYLNDVKQIRYQLIQWHGDYYFINDGDKYAKNTKLYLSNTYVAGTGLAAGLYEFGADGKMQLKNGPQDDGYFYENGIRSNKLYRFVEFEGDWYFIYDAYKYAKNAHLYLSGAFLEGTDFAPGYFDFDADGKYYIPEELPEGANADGYFYINGVKQTRYQLIKNGNDYYFINDNDFYAKNTKLYLSSTYVSGTDLPAGLYEFGADGKMIISAMKNGPQDDGYFYINGARCQKLYRFVEFDGDWYFINDGYKYAKNARLYLGNAFLEGTDFAPGYFVFGADGKLVTA